MAPLASFHRITVRPSARIKDLRLIFTDRHAAKRQHPGLRYMVIGLCGARRTKGMTLPPSLVDREIIAFWDDEQAYKEFMDGPVMRRWRSAGEVFSVALHPTAGHGDWGGSDALADAELGASHDGSLVVLTYARVRLRDAITWYTRVSAPAGRAMAESPNLLGGTGGANWTGLTTFTMSAWPSKRAMLGAAYAKGNNHGQHVAWGKEHLGISIGHFTPGETSGQWLGTSFSLGQPATPSPTATAPSSTAAGTA